MFKLKLNNLKVLMETLKIKLYVIFPNNRDIYAIISIIDNY